MREFEEEEFDGEEPSPEWRRACEWVVNARSEFEALKAAAKLGRSPERKRFEGEHLDESDLQEELPQAGVWRAFSLGMGSIQESEADRSIGEAASFRVRTETTEDFGGSIFEFSIERAERLASLEANPDGWSEEEGIREEVAALIERSRLADGSSAGSSAPKRRGAL